jgi:putative oxygen-independent coproporphyrinogen III oxidase
VACDPGVVTAGLYLHVPFCAHRCHYCDFNTYAGLDDQIPRYVEALRADIRRVAADGPGAVSPPGTETAADWPAFTSIFVGGGTPTYIPAPDLAGIVALAREVLPIAADAEITVEANPETVDAEYFAQLRAAGVNRISMGAQSFTPAVLEQLGRWHDRDRPLRAAADARAAGIGNVSLDLIYGSPAETDTDWSQTLDTVIAAGTDHVSAYALTVEANTEYAARIRQGSAIAPDDDVQADRMRVADQRLTAAGFVRYELSNWARPGFECRHNLTYWRNGNWLGIGAGAHGHWDGRRWWSLRAPARYADAALTGDTTTAGEEITTPQQQRTERLLLGLRTVEGVARDSVEPLDNAQVAALTAAGLLVADDRLRLAPAGWALANEVTVRLLG